MTLRTLISTMSSGAKIASAIIGGVLSVATLTGVIYGAGMKKQSKLHKETSYESKIDKLIASDSLKVFRYDSISDTLAMILRSQEEIIAKQEEAKEAYNGLRGVVIDLAKKQKVTLDELQKITEDAPVLKKKLIP